MPRGRKQLTDKQERILVQCQLMGLKSANAATYEMLGRLFVTNVLESAKRKLSDAS